MQLSSSLNSLSRGKSEPILEGLKYHCGRLRELRNSSRFFVAMSRVPMSSKVVTWLPEPGTMTLSNGESVNCDVKCPLIGGRTGLM
jgi:hypothetical protein